MKQHFIAAALAGLTAFNANALATGDIAFTSFNADEDGWAIVALNDISANTTVFFSDNTFSAGAFANTESFLTWTSGASQVNAGTVVRFIGQNNGTDYTVVSSSAGILSVTVDGNAGLSATSETLYAYQAATYDASSRTFLSAVTTEGGVAATTALTNAGLSAGTNAVSVTASTDFAQYTGARSNEAGFADYRPLVNSAANWNVVVGGNNELVVPDTTAFTITAVPEPETNAMMLAGLLAVGILRRRRS